jgi:AdoMet-dependent heme synthase
MIDGRKDVLRYRASADDVAGIFRNSALVGNVEEFCAPPQVVDEDILDGLPCSAGHTACYISPYGDLYPCVQFPLLCGNVRQRPFGEIWSKSPQLSEVRSIRGRDLGTCSDCSHLGTCSRCPGLAYMEGNMRGPSSVDCEKSFIRTGIPSAGMLMRGRAVEHTASRSLVQIQLPS